MPVQATEPSVLIPLIRGAECVVLAGDPKQLPPTVISQGALECSLDQTLFQRLQTAGPPSLRVFGLLLRGFRARPPLRVFGFLLRGFRAHPPAGFSGSLLGF